MHAHVCLVYICVCTPVTGRKLTGAGCCRDHFEKNVDKWYEYYNSKEPHKMELPDSWQKDLNEFQRMIVLRCIRPDKVSF